MRFGSRACFRFGVNLALWCLLMTPGQEAENVRRALRLAPRGCEMRATQHLFGYRDDLLAHEDAEQTHQRHHGRRWRSYVEQAVDNADQDTGPKGQKVDAHRGHPMRGVITLPPAAILREA